MVGGNETVVDVVIGVVSAALMCYLVVVIVAEYLKAISCYIRIARIDGLTIVVPADVIVLIVHCSNDIVVMTHCR